MLVDEFFARFGVPHELHSDPGREIESEVFRESCQLLGVTKTRTTPLRQQLDGMVVLQLYAWRGASEVLPGRAGGMGLENPYAPHGLSFSRTLSDWVHAGRLMWARAEAACGFRYWQDTGREHAHYSHLLCVCPTESPTRSAPSVITRMFRTR